MGRSRMIVMALGAGAAILSAPVQADTKAGVDAWTKGDFPAAVRAWQMEALKGDADALFNLGQAYRLGKGVPQDLAKAEELFGRAAALGHLQASDNYGLLLFQRGEHARAMPFVSAAAERGEPRAQYLLGIAHFNGQLVAKDWPRAYALVSLANQQGVGPAVAALKQMDGFIPLDQRQQGVQLATDLQAKADATRTRQLAAADLDAAAPPQRAPVSPKGVAAPAPVDPVARARVAAANDSPATAGADYARPATRPATLPAPAPAPRPAAVRQPAAPPPAPAPGASASANGPWRVQLGAFGVAGNADALWAKVRARPELTGHPRITVKAGSVTKLQAGGFSSQAEARTACSRLVAAGYTCVATLN